MTDAESQLLEAARAGDRAALEKLLALVMPRIFRFGQKMCGDRSDAEDVLQETLLAAAKGIRDFRGHASVATWLFTIARSFCIKKRRRSKFAPEHEASLDEPSVESRKLLDRRPGPEEAVAAIEVSEELRRAIDELDPLSREVLLLRDEEGLSAKEVADVVGMTVVAVKSRLHRARSVVRSKMAPLLGERAAEAPAAGDCPDAVHLFSQHLEGEISSDVCAGMQEHLARCPRCRSACATLQETLSLCRREAGTEVPAAVQARVRTALHELLRAT